MQGTTGAACVTSKPKSWATETLSFLGSKYNTVVLLYSLDLPLFQSKPFSPVSGSILNKVGKKRKKELVAI